MERCPLCQIELSGGWQFDSSRVNQAIMAYIDDWFAGSVPDEVLTRRRECDRLRKEVEAERGQSGPLWKHG